MAGQNSYLHSSATNQHNNKLKRNEEWGSLWWTKLTIEGNIVKLLKNCLYWTAIDFVLTKPQIYSNYAEDFDYSGEFVLPFCLTNTNRVQIRPLSIIKKPSKCELWLKLKPAVKRFIMAQGMMVIKSNCYGPREKLALSNSNMAV